MASNLTGQVRNIAEVATAIASGDLSRKITVDVRGENNHADAFPLAIPATRGIPGFRAENEVIPVLRPVLNLHKLDHIEDANLKLFCEADYECAVKRSVQS